MPDSVLGLQTDRIVEGRRILHGAQQDLRVDDRLLGLREGNAAGKRQAGHLGQFFAGELLGQRANREHARQTERLAAPHQAFNQPWLIERRVGIGRTGDRGDTAGHGGEEFGLQIGQASGQIDQTRTNDQPSGVNGPLRPKLFRLLAERSNPAVCNKNIGSRIDAVFRVDDSAVLDMNLHGLEFVVHRSVPRQNAHYRHAYRDAEGDLRQNDRLRPIGDFGVDLNTAVHRSRMHHNGVLLGQRQGVRR